MKYYIYISDAKVDMLLPQIPYDKKKKIATEFKIDLKVLSLSRKDEREINDNRIARLEAVCEFLREYGNVGSIDYPDEYIEDTQLARWAPVSLISGRIENAPFVFFGGNTERTAFGISGSIKHLLSNTEPPNNITCSPNASSLVAFMIYLGLAVDYDGAPELLVGKVPELQKAVIEMREAHYRLPNKPPNYWAISYFIRQMEEMLLPAQKLEFFAKRLFHSESDTRSPEILLATPLYVAMAE